MTQNAGNTSIDITPSLTIEGWMTANELTYLASLASRSTTIVEIGSWAGRTTCALASHTTGTVFAVDNWGGEIAYKADFNADIFNRFMANTKDFSNIWPVPLTSIGAAGLFAQVGIRFDLVFIDADHEYESVREDILAWKPLLKPNAILCGHDYTAPPHPGVRRAVDELVGKVRLIDTIWSTEGI